MPDPLSPLFDDLRRREIPQVQAPGADAARRTVHRRATARAIAVAAVVMTVGGSWILNQRGDSGSFAPASPRESSASGYAGYPGPESTGELWRGRPDKTEITAGLVPDASHADVVGDMDQDVGWEAAAGNHLLRVGCSGPAPLPITILVNDTVERQETIACTDAGAAHEFDITVEWAGSVDVVISRVGQFDAYAMKLSNA